MSRGSLFVHQAILTAKWQWEFLRRNPSYRAEWTALIRQHEELLKSAGGDPQRLALLFSFQRLKETPCKTRRDIAGCRAIEGFCARWGVRYPADPQYPRQKSPALWKPAGTIYSQGLPTHPLTTGPSTYISGAPLAARRYEYVFIGLTASDRETMRALREYFREKMPSRVRWKSKMRAVTPARRPRRDRDDGIAFKVAIQGSIEKFKRHRLPYLAVRVDCAAPREALLAQIKECIREIRLREHRHQSHALQTRRRLDDYPQYLRAYDLQRKHPNWNTLSIGQRLFPMLEAKTSEEEDCLRKRAKFLLARAKHLINGGYRAITTPTIPSPT